MIDMGKREKEQAPVLMVADIGGSKYMPGFVDCSGNILYQERREWADPNPDAIVGQLTDALRDICRKRPELAERAEAGGLTIPGFADPETGVWVDSDFLVVKDLPICDILSREFGIPFFADNDCNACALAEQYFGGAKDQSTFLYMTVSTGIGGALYLNGELYYGGFWHAGEIGLFVVEEDGRPSDTGSVNGIVEMYASGRALAQNYIAAGGEKTINGKEPGGREIAALAEQGDEAALKALELEGKYLGRVIANACAFADFGKVILGGGISLIFEKYKDALVKEFSRCQPGKTPVIEATALGYSGAFLGAAAAALRGMKGFTKGPGMGDGRETALYIRVGRTIDARLEMGGGVRSLPLDFGSFLTAEGIHTDGITLNEAAVKYEIQKLKKQADRKEAEAEKKLVLMGRRLGKAIACACVLLDPGRVVLRGNGLTDDSFCGALLETVKKETYYRGNLPFTIEYEESCISEEQR